MKLLQLYNQYRSLHGGEENVVWMTDGLMKSRGHDSRVLLRSSRGLDRSLWGKFKACAAAYYNRSAYREVARELAANRPDVMHVHNLYPMFSPAVLAAARRAEVPVVMTNHNYVLTCPMTHHLRHSQVCEKCLGGREYHCVLNNCRSNLAESFAYASRSWFARRRRYFLDCVDAYVVLTDFARRQLVRGGFDPEKISVIPNPVDLSHEPGDAGSGGYVAFSGRMDHEKGVDTLLAAIRELPAIPVRLAGDGPLFEKLRTQAPSNCKFLGRLDAAQMNDFYHRARMVVIPSRWYEGCPLVVSEAMSHAVPLVVSRMGGLPDLVGDGECGLVFTPNNVQELRDRIESLWHDRARCRKLGAAGRAKAAAHYSEEVYYQQLMVIYEKLIQHGAVVRGPTSVTPARPAAAARDPSPAAAHV